MSDIAIIPEASSRPLVHALNRRQPVPIEVAVQILSDRELQELLEGDIDQRFIADPRSLDEIIGTGDKTFARYRGKRTSLLTELEQRPRIDFLSLCYIGKIPNHVQTGDVTFDLAEICFFKRLEVFSRQLELILGKQVSYSIAVEDDFFDRHIFEYDGSIAESTLLRSRRELAKTGCTHVKTEPLSTYLGDGFLSVFETCLSELPRSCGNISKAMRRTFELAYPTTSYEAALGQYASPREREDVRRWAEERARRYMAFFTARDRTRFWEQNNRFMRATDSERQSVVQVEFGIGRVSVPHGVAVVRGGGRIDCEYYHDFVSERARADEAVVELVDERGEHLAFR